MIFRTAGAADVCRRTVMVRLPCVKVDLGVAVGEGGSRGYPPSTLNYHSRPVCSVSKCHVQVATMPFFIFFFPRPLWAIE